MTDLSPSQLKKPLGLSILIAALSGCNAVVTTPYVAPPVDIPTTYQQAHISKPNKTTSITDRWWTQFGDTQLNQLVERVITQNADLALGGINLQKARLQAGLAADQQGLRVGANGSTGYEVNLGNGNRSGRGLSVNATVSYVVDLFGKLSNQTEAAQWAAAASEQDLQATAQSLIGTTCQLYWQLGYLNDRLHAAQTNLASSQKLAQLVRVQYKNGAVSGLEMTQAEQSVQSQLSSLTQLKQQKVETRAALALLLHQPLESAQLPEPKRLPNATLPAIAAGLPAELLARRPDVKAAELRLREAFVQRDATTASYYPSLSLTGSLGSSSTSLLQLLKNPLLALGANLSLPFLQKNDMQRNIAISDLTYQATIINYRKTLYQAFSDVDQALSNRLSLAEQFQQQQKTVNLARKNVQLNQVRYQNGAIALKHVIDAQDAARSAELALTEVRYHQYVAYVTLMQALGGSPLKIASI